MSHLFPPITEDDFITTKLDLLGIRISDMYSYDIKARLAEDMDTKKKFYSGSRYVSSLEKEYIYLSESTRSLTDSIVNYLISGAPELKTADEIENFARITSTHPARYTAATCLKYLYGELPENEEYEAYREMKLFREQYAGTGGYSHIFEEIYKEAYASNTVAQIFLKSVLRHRRYFAGAGKGEILRDLVGIVKARAELYGLICIGHNTWAQ